MCAEGQTGNAFRDALRRITSEHEMQLIVRGLVVLLNNPHQANNTLLPSSMKQIACFQEVTSMPMHACGASVCMHECSQIKVCASFCSSGPT